MASRAIGNNWLSSHLDMKRAKVGPELRQSLQHWLSCWSSLFTEHSTNDVDD
jgi:hypothetical protein